MGEMNYEPRNSGGLYKLDKKNQNNDTISLRASKKEYSPAQ